jgi:hypothetical protein
MIVLYQGESSPRLRLQLPIDVTDYIARLSLDAEGVVVGPVVDGFITHIPGKPVINLHLKIPVNKIAESERPGWGIYWQPDEPDRELPARIEVDVK